MCYGFELLYIETISVFTACSDHERKYRKLITEGSRHIRSGNILYQVNIE